MDYSVESFIDFCDEYQEANEGLKSVSKQIKNVLASIRRSFKNINSWCKNILSNINYFKEARLDDQMNNDLKSVLKTSQPRTELNFKPIQLYYKAISLVKKEDMKVNRLVVGEVYEKSGYKENFSDLVNRSNIDTMEAISAAKKSDAYKRLQKNNYSQKNITVIPLDQITSDIKKTNSMATTFGNQMDELEHSMDDNEKTSSLRSKMMSFIRTVISYCTFRIQVLGKYLNTARASITGTIKNFVSKGEKTRSDLKYRIPKVTKTKKISDYQKFKECVETMRSTDEYSEYKESYEYVTKELGIEDHVIKKLTLNDQKEEVSIIALKDDGDMIDVSNSKLYHVSDNPNLTELIPFFRSKSGTTFFPTPRIYVHLNVPLNRLGSTVQMSEEKGDTVVYRVSQKVSKAKVDREIGKTAVFIESSSPIKIKKMDYSKLKGAMTRKINSNINEIGGE